MKSFKDRDNKDEEQTRKLSQDDGKENDGKK